MKRNIYLFILTFIFALSACKDSIKAEGESRVVRDFRVQNFDEISADGRFKMILIPNDSSYVSVQSHENLIENLDIYVRNKTLHVKEKKQVENFESYVVYLYFNDIKEVAIAGKILLEASETLFFDDFELNTADASIVQQFELSSKEANISVLDKSEVEIQGEVSKLKLKAKDYAKVDLLALETKIMEVDLGGNADVEVNVKDELSGRILQNSSLKHDGNPIKSIEVKENAEISKY